jgi:hypothetical protein
MPRMIELIEASAVPTNIVQSAAKGALAVPALEMVEILVYLATHNPVFGEQARLTLAGWDEKSARAIATDLNAPKGVLNYMVAPQNVRPALLPTLLENLSVSDAALAELGASASRELVEVMMSSARVTLSQPILAGLSTNPNLSGILAETIKQKLAPAVDEVLADANAESEPDDVLDQELMAYLAQHAREIADEEDKPFKAIGGVYDDILEPVEALADAASAGTAGATTKAFAGKKSSLNMSEQRGSALQKISKLDVKGRIQLAMKGSKEERSILVRDGTKVVALAVLESPKITDAEVEMIASQKNVLEAVLRGIPMKRRFVKHYPIVRNIVCNPRTPLDTSLTLIKNLQVNDLKNLSANKDVSETVRKLAVKMYKQKHDSSKK